MPNKHSGLTIICNFPFPPFFALNEHNHWSRNPGFPAPLYWRFLLLANPHPALLHSPGGWSNLHPYLRTVVLSWWGRAEHSEQCWISSLVRLLPFPALIFPAWVAPTTTLHGLPAVRTPRSPRPPHQVHDRSLLTTPLTVASTTPSLP